MIQARKIYTLLFIIITSGSLFLLKAGERDSNNSGKYFANEEMMSDFFQKLEDISKSRKGKINIVHIGDSHIQAGYLTGRVRDALQDVFGNGGSGLSFPYELVRTNSKREVYYVSNTSWTSAQNIRGISDIKIGITGMALATEAKNFVLQLSEDNYGFNRIKMIYPTEKPQFKLSTTAQPLKVTFIVTSGGKTHKVRSGESLSGIAQKYGTSIAQIKKANNMRNDKIFAGKTLKISTRSTTQVANVKMEDNIEFVPTTSHPYYSTYTSNTPLHRVTIFPKEGHSQYTINGFVLENNNSGIIYHTIGVNGAHMSDYNKYPLFFRQLPVLEPDLIIISLGTNESFARMSAGEYTRQIQDFVARIRSAVPNATVLVTTPPPSLFRRKRVNPFVGEYAKVLTAQNNFPVWDLYAHMGGLAGIQKGRFAPMMARDNVHYTQSGYELQGTMLATDLMNAYNYYREQKKK